MQREKRYLLILVFAFLLASVLFVCLAVTPADISARGSNTAVLNRAFINGTSPDYFGASLVAFDFNNDSYNDLAIGASGKTLTGGSKTYFGQIYVFFGGSSGILNYTAAEANITINGTSPGFLQRR